MLWWLKVSNDGKGLFSGNQNIVNLLDKDRKTKGERNSCHETVFKALFILARDKGWRKRQAVINRRLIKTTKYILRVHSCIANVHPCRHQVFMQNKPPSALLINSWTLGRLVSQDYFKKKGWVRYLASKTEDQRSSAGRK